MGEGQGVRLNKKAAAGAPQPETTGGNDLTVNRRTTIRQHPGIDGRDEEFLADGQGHVVRSFLWVLQYECPLIVQAKVYTSQLKCVKAYNVKCRCEEEPRDDEASRSAVATQSPVSRRLLRYARNDIKP
jgi:hypothetical protein